MRWVGQFRLGEIFVLHVKTAVWASGSIAKHIQRLLDIHNLFLKLDGHSLAAVRAGEGAFQVFLSFEVAVNLDCDDDQDGGYTAAYDKCIHYLLLVKILGIFASWVLYYRFICLSTLA